MVSQVIPPGQTVLLDMSPPELFMVLVEGSLVFDRVDLTLDLSYFLMLGGSLEVGTEEDPFMQHATITLHGDRYKSIVLPDVGSKMLVAYNRNQIDPDEVNAGQPLNMNMAMDGGQVQFGSIEIHGQPRLRSWTKVRRSCCVCDEA